MEMGRSICNGTGKYRLKFMVKKQTKQTKNKSQLTASYPIGSSFTSTSRKSSGQAEESNSSTETNINRKVKPIALCAT